ncbi:uncharacterized protein LOC133922407 [Phragmites australis]|uniref:uncharacterized protein LOC133922407 n=1 Tax=Phragmites australis TaxID=29695 RepID=UPI002D76689D|nr:uncharacterized protein LOC133922407 [Phragmites australis]
MPSKSMQSMTLDMPNAVRAMSSHLGAPVAREPLLQPDLPPPPQIRAEGGPPGDADAAGHGRSFPWLATAGFGYLTFSSGMALHRSRGDPGAVAFILFAYVDLVLLFYCLRRYERAEPGSPLRDWLKVAVWLLTASLTLLFSYKVAAVMPAAVAVLVWVLGLATITGGFVAFFCSKRRKTSVRL